MNSPKILFLDIETTPNLADVWSLWNQNVALAQLRESTRLLCFAWKWHKNPSTYVTSEVSGHANMVKKAHQILDAADIVVHYNGKKFDIPHLQREFVQAGLLPPSPFRQVDLCEVVKRQFRFPSNKLAYVTKTLGLTGKYAHEGHELWVKCMAGDPEAWQEMLNYNCQDVETTEELYERLLPWIPNHPHMGLYVDVAKPVCANCGCTDLQRRGTVPTSLGLFQRYQCKSCGRWSRGGKAVNRVDVRGVV